MPTRWETFPVELRGGRTEILPSIQQGIKAPGSAIFLTNFEPSLLGGYRRINGYTKFDTNVVPSTDSTTQILGIGFLDGEIIIPRESKIYSSTGSGWTEIATGRTQTTKHRFYVTNLDGTRHIIGVDGVNYPYRYDGTTFTDWAGNTDIEGSSHVVEFKDHIFFAKGGLVTFAAPFSYTDFTPANGAGSFIMPNEITGMIVFRERMFVFTETEIKVLSGNSVSDFSLTSVSESVGCIKEDTIEEVAGDVMFLSADGLRLLGATDRIGDFSNEAASKNIQPLMTSFVETYSQFSSTVIREKSQYRIFGWSSQESAEATEGWLGTQFEPANPNSFEWSQMFGIKVFAILSEIYQGEELIYFVGDTNYVYRLESGINFDGTAVKASFRTPFISMGDPTIRKTIYSVKTYLEAEDSMTGTLRLSFDQGTSSRVQPSSSSLTDGGGVKWNQTTWDNFNWASGTVDGSVKTTTQGSGFSVSLQYDFVEDQAPFVLDTIFIEYSMEDRK